MLPAGLALAPAQVRYATARRTLRRRGVDPAASPRRLPCADLWWRTVRLAAATGGLHWCAERMARHLSWQLAGRHTTDHITAVLTSYADHYQVSARTAWTDLGRLVDAGWITPTRAPANTGPTTRQGPGTGRRARYTLTVPAALAAHLAPPPPRRPRRRQPPAQLADQTTPQPTSLDSFFFSRGNPPPTVPHPPHPPSTGTNPALTPTQRRDASALLAGCHPAWRRQRPSTALIDHHDWHTLLPLVAAACHHHPPTTVTAALTDRIRTARNLTHVLTWRLTRLLTTPPPPQPATPPAIPAAAVAPPHVPARAALPPRLPPDTTRHWATRTRTALTHAT